jgi:branched-chain amino acid transport system permease protein
VDLLLTNSGSLLLNSAAYGLLLFIMAVGLTIIFGLLDVLNLAHGALYLVGSYIGYRIAGEATATWGSFTLSLGVALVLGIALGLGLMLALLPLTKRGHLDQALLTLGLGLVITEVLLEIFGRDDRGMAVPVEVAGSTMVFGVAYPTYRLVVIAIGAVLAAGVLFLLERTRAGAIVRATVADRDMVQAVGINVGKVSLLAFTGAVALAVLGGVLAAPINGVASGVANETLLLALVVVVVGGLGSVVGTLVGALLIGLVQNFGVALFPELAAFLLFGAMILVIAFRPQGLIAIRTAVAR